MVEGLHVEVPHVDPGPGPHTHVPWWEISVGYKESQVSIEIEVQEWGWGVPPVTSGSPQSRGPPVETEEYRLGSPEDPGSRDRGSPERSLHVLVRDYVGVGWGP